MGIWIFRKNNSKVWILSFVQLGPGSQNLTILKYCRLWLLHPDYLTTDLCIQAGSSQTAMGTFQILESTSEWQPWITKGTNKKRLEGNTSCCWNHISIKTKPNSQTKTWTAVFHYKLGSGTMFTGQNFLQTGWHFGSSYLDRDQCRQKVKWS